MGYQVGDEALVKARIIEDCIGICGLKIQEGIVFNAKKENLLPIPDMTAEEAWEIARKIVLLEDEGGISAKDMVHMFGVKFPRDIIREYSVREVKTRIEAWEAEKEIKVGDVVRVTLGKLDEGETDTALITWVHENNWYDLIMKNGLGWTYVNGERIKKTGRHVGIEGILKQIGGDE